MDNLKTMPPASAIEVAETQKRVNEVITEYITNYREKSLTLFTLNTESVKTFTH